MLSGCSAPCHTHVFAIRYVLHGGIYPYLLSLAFSTDETEYMKPNTKLFNYEPMHVKSYSYRSLHVCYV